MACIDRQILHGAIFTSGHVAVFSWIVKTVILYFIIMYASSDAWIIVKWKIPFQLIVIGLSFMVVFGLRSLYPRSSGIPTIAVDALRSIDLESIPIPESVQQGVALIEDNLIEADKGDFLQM